MLVGLAATVLMRADHPFAGAKDARHKLFVACAAGRSLGKEGLVRRVGEVILMSESSLNHHPIVSVTLSMPIGLESTTDN